MIRAMLTKRLQWDSVQHVDPFPTRMVCGPSPLTRIGPSRIAAAFMFVSILAVLAAVTSARGRANVPSRSTVGIQADVGRLCHVGNIVSSVLGPVLAKTHGFSNDFAFTIVGSKPRELVCAGRRSTTVTFVAQSLCSEQGRG